MTRHHPTLTRLTRSLRPTAADLAAAAALHDPSLLLQLRAARLHSEPPCPAR